MYKIVNVKTGRKVANKMFKTYETARKYAIREVRKIRFAAEKIVKGKQYRDASYPTLKEIGWSVRKAA